MLYPHLIRDLEFSGYRRGLHSSDWRLVCSCSDWILLLACQSFFHLIGQGIQLRIRLCKRLVFLDGNGMNSTNASVKLL